MLIITVPTLFLVLHFSLKGFISTVNQLSPKYENINLKAPFSSWRKKNFPCDFSLTVKELWMSVHYIFIVEMFGF